MGPEGTPAQARAKVVLVDGTGERFFGPGVMQLLDAVAETGSVKAACAHIGLSYSKGWRLLHTLEASWGRPMVARRQGGIGGGHATLTPDALALRERFAAFTADVDADVATRFAAHFPELTR